MLLQTKLSTCFIDFLPMTVVSTKYFGIKYLFIITKILCQRSSQNVTIVIFPPKLPTLVLNTGAAGSLRPPKAAL